MTRPLTLWLAELLGPDEPDAINRAQNALVGLLRHPAMREPSAAVDEAVFSVLFDAGPSLPIPTRPAWRAGCDALAREIEEASR